MKCGSRAKTARRQLSLHSKVFWFDKGSGPVVTAWVTERNEGPPF